MAQPSTHGPGFAPGLSRPVAPAPRGYVAHTLIMLLGMLVVSADLNAHPSEIELFNLVGERLGLMQDVALDKWHKQRPIEDTARERVVLNAARRTAVAAGIDGDAAEAFFALQVTAAKEIQQYWFDHWQTRPPDQPAPDLNTVTRPRLIRLGDAIVAAMAAVPVTSTAIDTFEQHVSVAGISPATRAALFIALGKIQRWNSVLERVSATGILRVGTTGDYAPFSYAGNAAGDSDGLTGIDINLAGNLAASLGAKLQLVRTAWPTLADDLVDGRFDIAMSGVSRNTARARIGHFSLPYFEDGKTAIARCTDAGKLNSLPAINQPDVRVIVNPGGTNEQFTRAHITRANIILHPDNRTIFDEISAGRADVMITDGIEVRLQAALNPSLCGTLAQKLTRLDKAYLLPKDLAFKVYVDIWLDLLLKDGTVDRLIEQHLE